VIALRRRTQGSRCAATLGYAISTALRWSAIFVALLLVAGTSLAAEPLVVLHLDEGQGTTCADAAGSAKAQVVQGDIGPLWVRGPSGSALWFSGRGDQCVTLPDRPELSLTSELTLSAWIWPSQMGGFQTIVWKGDRRGEIAQVNYRLALRPEGRLEFSFKGPADEWYPLAASESVQVGKWSHVVAVYNRGQVSLHVDGRRVAQGRAGVYWSQGVKPGVWRGDRLLANHAPLEVGRGQESDGGPGQCFRGAIDEVCLWPTALAVLPKSPAPPTASPLASLLLFERQLAAAELEATAYLTGRIAGRAAPWVLHVDCPDVKNRGLWLPGVTTSDGRFRYLLNDFGGPIEPRGAERMTVRAYRRNLADKSVAQDVGLDAGPSSANVVVEPAQRLQSIRCFGAYADIPGTFLASAEERRTQYGPLLAELKEIGVTQLDFATLAQWIEPKNDDADPQHIDWDRFRSHFQADPHVQTLVKYLRYLESEGFTVGLRLQGYAGWQWVERPGGKRQPNAEEVAEHCVALLTLMREAGIHVTHMVPIWEPTYAPECVAQVCAETARLARQHGIQTPIVGPYTYATGGQSTHMDAMPDRYSVGPRYVGPYLKIAGQLCDVIGVEDYASGCALIEPNLKRLWREVIDPLGTAGRPKELWMLEYGTPCGVGPWNFYPSRWHGTYAGYDSAFRLARCLHQQFNGRVSGFFFWKAYDVVGDGRLISCCGLVKSDQHDAERRPPFYVARMFWKHIPRGAQHVACTSTSDVLANAFVDGRRSIVVLSNPRPTSVRANVRLAGLELAPTARLYTSTEEIKYQEREVAARADTVPAIVLPPRSVSTLVCRAAQVDRPFDRTVWGDVPGAVFLGDLQWAAVSAAGGKGLVRDEIDGQNVDAAQDENARHDWIVVGRTRYRKGLGVRVPSQVVYDLGGNYASFEADLGMDDATDKQRAIAGLIFEVLVDGKKAFTSGPLKLGQKPLPVSVPCAGAKELTLSVRPAAGSGEKVMAAWGNARLTRRK
jgi:hypothetical protein